MNENEKQSITYKYDELNRLISSVENNGLFEKVYKYDSFGNVVHEINGQNEIFNYSYNNRENLVKKYKKKTDTARPYYAMTIMLLIKW